MYWDKEYEKKSQLWGERPSVLAAAAVEHLKRFQSTATVSILDIGCGYGRDAFHYAEFLMCTVRGIDVSEKAIAMASKTAAEKEIANADFEVMDLKDLKDGMYDVVTASNLYQLLRKEERDELANAVTRMLKPGGVLFLSTLSVNDPEHAGKGTPIAGESNSYSYQDRIYLHLCTKEELMADFAFLNITELNEHEYDEPRVTGEVHHHISWILMGKRKDV